MLVEAHAVEPQLVHEAPSLKMLLVILDGDFGDEVLLGKWEGEFAVLFEVVEMFRVREKVETEHLHTSKPPSGGQETGRLAKAGTAHADDCGE